MLNKISGLTSLVIKSEVNNWLYQNLFNENLMDNSYYPLD